MSTDGSFRSVINLGNSIIGVSILAMPYCFHKCGILLSALLILSSGFLTKATCHLLLKAAIMGRRRNFEFLAFHTFGTMGKFAVELGIIGFLLGTCIAFFVVVGDLGPPLASDIFTVENSSKLRVEVLLFLGFFVGLPLGLLKRVDSLSVLSTLSVCFYVFLILKILIEALPNFSYEKLIYEMNWWQPSGLLSCLPIFAMALSCQTQLFEIFDTLNDPNLKRMDSVVSSAVHLCSVVYTMVGLFGYVAFYDQTITGNVLVKLPSTDLTKVIKLCFVLTIVVSFPLCLFPCRSSLHSLLFKPGVSIHDMPGNLIPDHRFRLLTFLLVAVTVGTAIMIPNIEFVLGILGSTIGAVISFILPAMVFIRMTNKNTNERILAKMVLCIGLFILIACSYSTLHESAKPKDIVIKHPTIDVLPFAAKLPKQDEKPMPKIEIITPPKPTANQVSLNNPKLEPKQDVVAMKDTVVLKDKDEAKESEKRQEPPIPQEPDEPQPAAVRAEIEKTKDIAAPVLDAKIKDVNLDIKNKDVENQSKSVDKNPVVSPHNAASNDIHPDALKKEDKELKNGPVTPNASDQLEKKAEKKAIEAERKAVAAEKKAEEASQKQDELLRKIEAQQVEQKKLLEEQRKLLLELKEHKESHRIEDEKKLAEPVVNDEKDQLANLKPESNQNQPQNNEVNGQQNANVIKQNEDPRPKVDTKEENNQINSKAPKPQDTNNVKAEINISKAESKVKEKLANIPSNSINLELKPIRNSQNELPADKIVRNPVPIKNVVAHSPKNYVNDPPQQPSLDISKNLKPKQVKLPDVPAPNAPNVINVNSQNTNNGLPNNMKLKQTSNAAVPKKGVPKTNLDIPVAKRLSDSFQNGKVGQESKVYKRSVSVDPNDVVFNISKPDVTNINQPKMSFAAVKNEIRKLLSYHEKRKNKK